MSWAVARELNGTEGSCFPDLTRLDAVPTATSRELAPVAAVGVSPPAEVGAFALSLPLRPHDDAASTVRIMLATECRARRIRLMRDTVLCRLNGYELLFPTKQISRLASFEARRDGKEFVDRNDNQRRRRRIA